jgi:hypothetical protein
LVCVAAAAMTGGPSFRTLPRSSASPSSASCFDLLETHVLPPAGG